MKLDSKTISLACVCLLVGGGIGFAGMNIYNSKQEETYRLKTTDKVYKLPTLVSISAVYDKKSDKHLIVDRIKMDAPTTVQYANHAGIEEKDELQYHLNPGEFYMVDESKPEDKSKCRIKVITLKKKEETLDVSKHNLIPLEEGEWIKIKNSQNEEGWIQVQSNWQKQ